MGIDFDDRDELVKSEDLTKDMNRFLKDRTGMVVKEFYERVTGKLEALVDVLADDLMDKHDKVPPQSLPIALGIMLDKVNLLKGRPQALTANLSMGFGPKKRSRKEILEILGGEKPLGEE